MNFNYMSIVDNDMPGAWPVGTPGARLAGFIKRTAILELGTTKNKVPRYITVFSQVPWYVSRCTRSYIETVWALWCSTLNVWELGNSFVFLPLPKSSLKRSDLTLPIRT